jgi:hypothetical protein
MMHGRKEQEHRRMTAEHLGREHAHTLQKIFQHPLSHNIEWRLVRTLLEAVGSVTEEHNGHLRVTINGESFTVHRPLGKDVADVQTLIDLRHFLERVGITPNGPHDKGEPGDDTPAHAGDD